MAIMAASRFWKETRDVMMRKYLAAEKMATDDDLAAVQRKNWATYNDFLREFTLVALRIPGVMARIMSKYFLRQFSEFDKDKILSAYQQTSKFVNTKDVDFSTVTDLAEKTVVTEMLALLKEGEVINLTGRTGDKVKKGIESLHEQVHGVDNKIERVENALLVMQVSPRLLKGLRQLLTRWRVEINENPEASEEEREEKAPQEVANLQRSRGDLEDLEKAFANICLSLPDREGGEVMRAPPGTKLSFHALPVGKLKIQIGTHHTDALVDGGVEITLIRRDFTTITGCTVNKEVTRSIWGAGGEISFVGYVTKCAVKAGVRELIWSFQRITVMEEMDHDIILERPWCANVEMIGMHLHDGTYMVDIEDPVTGRGYDQLSLDVRDRPYTAMHTPVGQLQMQVTAMGFTNVVAEAQRRMLTVAGDMFPEKCEPYIDDNPIKDAQEKDETEVQPGIRRLDDDPRMTKEELIEARCQQVLKNEEVMKDIANQVLDSRMRDKARPTGGEEAGPSRGRRTTKRKLYIGLIAGPVVGRGGRKCICRRPSPLREGEGIEISSESEGEKERANVGEGRKADMGDKTQASDEGGANRGEQHESRHGESEGRQDMRNEHEEGEERRENPLEGRSGHDSCEGHETRIEIPYTYDPKNLTGEYSPIQTEEEEDEEEDVQEIIEISSGDERDEISRPREERRSPMHQPRDEVFRWEDEFGSTPSHWFQQWTNVIKHEWIIKTRELAKAGVVATPLDFFSEAELQEIAKKRREIETFGLGVRKHAEEQGGQGAEHA
ncbi:hypothetical protein CBR_g25986 [Chara braunii]|uniref:Peptidase A2 domain-containing protein n=1 Tax=Chara braunii TaxID=69332 RepID=A0A388L6W0_CHABU|nr:hypothetical protein CBR_g25986 [Chara braunii]|eukprot:GBG78050.1 hypothetical protein CBR_g25986 [Chara braunii]